MEHLEALKQLRAPFPPHQISKLPKALKRGDDDKGKCEPGSRYSADGVFCGGYHSRSIHLDYVGHAALTDRLLDCDPAWTWEPLAISPEGLPVLDGYGGMWIKLTVCGITRLGYGDSGDKTGPNAIKEAIGDALRNAAMRFGCALELWHKGDLHLSDDKLTAPSGKVPQVASEKPWFPDSPKPSPLVPPTAPSKAPDTEQPKFIGSAHAELLDAGRAAALNGTKALTDWWTNLGADQQKSVSTSFLSLKKAARQADGS